MKRFLAFVLTVVIIALSLSACKSDNNSDSDKLTLYVLENQWGGMGNSAIYYVYNRKASEKDKIELVTKPRTDLWQRTYYHFRNDNAPVLQMSTDEKFFSFVVKTEFES